MRLAILLFSCTAAFAQHPMMPDAKLTPGSLDPKVTQATIHQTICVPGYTAKVRNVSQAEKKEVMRRYGLPLAELSKVEIDHFESLELGGLNLVTGLWPQYYKTSSDPPDYLGAREKDVVETHLKKQVCSGAMTLAQAQAAIHNWPEVYRSLKKSGAQ